MNELYGVSEIWIVVRTSHFEPELRAKSCPSRKIDKLLLMLCKVAELRNPRCEPREGFCD